MTEMPEKSLLEAISKCCVTKQTLQARMSDLLRIKQDPGQTVQAFLANLKLKARQCEMKIKQKVQCSKTGCDQETEQEVDYGNVIIKNLFIVGLTDMELQQDLMVEEDLTLE